MTVRTAGLTLGFAAAVASMLHGQARSAPDWTTQGFDAQRTSWMRVDPYISLQNLEKFQFIWKLKLDNEPRHGNSLTAPVALGNLMTFRGFKSLIFVGGSSNNVYAIDYDFGTLFWRTHHNYTAGAREYAGSPTCPGGMTLPLTRATSLNPASQLAFFGFARPPRPAKGDVGEPGQGAPQLAEIAARLAARGSRGGADTPAGAAAPARGAPPPGRETTPGRGRGPNFVFSVAADGLLRSLIPDTGDPAAPPAKFLPANATANGLIWTDGMVYAATANTCGGAPEAVWGMDYALDGRPVTTWETDGAPIAGISVGPDGTVYAATGSGTSRYANAVVALENRTLKIKDWVTASDAFISTPVVFTEGDKTYIASTTNGRVYLLDASALGGTDHKTPLAMNPSDDTANLRFANDAVSTWRDAAGTRWILAATGGEIAAYKLVTTSGTAALERAWTSRTMVRPRAPMIVNGVIFAVGAGHSGASAVLFALDPASGRELWNSGTTLTSAASAGLSAGTGQIFVVTDDNTVWAFGIPLAIN
jgi:outer membrane protein assembly factor BamB